MQKPHQSVLGKCGINGHDEEFDLNRGSCPQCVADNVLPPRPISKDEREAMGEG